MVPGELGLLISAASAQGLQELVKQFPDLTRAQLDDELSSLSGASYVNLSSVRLGACGLAGGGGWKGLSWFRVEVPWGRGGGVQEGQCRGAQSGPCFKLAEFGLLRLGAG